MDGAVAALMGAALGGDLALEYLVGICPLLAMSRKIDTAIGFGFALLVVAPLVSMSSYLLVHEVLEPAGFGVVRIPVLVVAVYACVLLVAAAVRRWWPRGDAWLEVFFPLLTVNCTLLAVALIVVTDGAGVVAAVGAGCGLAFGFGVLLATFTALRERLAAAPVPQAFAGAPIAVITLAIIAMACRALGGAPR